MTEKEISPSKQELKDYIKEIVDGFKKGDFDIIERYSFHPKQAELVLKYMKEKHPDLHEKYDLYKRNKEHHHNEDSEEIKDPEDLDCSEDWPNKMWRK